MVHFFSVFTFVTVLHVLIIVGVSYRVIKVRLPVATSLAWLILVFFLPLLGAIAYLVLGEKRLGRKYMTRTQAIKGRYDAWLQNLSPEIRSDPQRLSPQARSLSRLAETTLNISAMSGNRLQLLDAAEPILRAMISDIDAAKRFCTIPGWCITPVAPTSMICWPLESGFSDLKAVCCTPKALWLTGK